MASTILTILLMLALLAAPAGRVWATTDTAFTTTRLNKFGSVVIILGTKFGFDISDFIIPFFTKAEEIAQPDHEPTATWKDQFLKTLTPQNYTDDGKHIRWDEQANPVFYTSLYGAILKTDADHSNHPPPTDCIISEGLEKSSDVPNAPLDFETARTSDAWLGINPIDPDESGVVDMNLPPKVLAGMNAGEDCKKHDPGFDREPVENDLKSLSHFGEGTMVEGEEMTTIMKIIEFFNRITGEWDTREVPDTEPHKDDVILTLKKRMPWYHIKTHDGGGPGNEAGEYSGNSAESGGWTAFTLREEDKKPVIAASLQPYEVSVLGFKQRPLKASYDLMNIAQVRMQQAACYSVPDTTNASMGDLQAVAAIGGKINIKPECGPQQEASKSAGWNCRTNLPELASEELNAAGQNWADNAIYTDACKTENAWELCHNDVIDRAKKACVDPLFALAIWLHESGASNYACGEQLTGGVPVEDFGIHTAGSPENFSVQLDNFLKLDYSCPHTMNDWWSMFWLGNGCFASVPDSPINPETGLTPKQEVEQDVGELQEIYTALGGGTLPSWPKGSCQQ